jgi:hypothetical protein
MMGLQEETALVGDATSGIGRATADGSRGTARL